MSGNCEESISDPDEENKILQYLSNEMASKWLFVGLNLGVPRGKLEQIQMDHRGNQQLINHKMLSEWLKISPNKSKQFLAKALLDAERRDLHDWVLSKGRQELPAPSNQEAELLQTNVDPMEKYHKIALTRGLDDLVENLVVEKVTIYLQKQKIIDNNDVQQMLCEKTRHKQVETLTLILKTKDKKAFPSFIDALRKHPLNHDCLANKLEELAVQAMRETTEQGKEKVEVRGGDILCETNRWHAKVAKLRDRRECETVKSIYFHEECDISGRKRGASVFLGVFENKMVAVKRIQHGDVEEEPEVFEAMKNKDIPHVLDLLCVEKDRYFTYIVSELCECDLQCLIEDKKCPLRKSLTIEKRMDLCVQLFVGIQNLHELDIIHRDLKPKNVLVDKYLAIRVADFGKSRKLPLCKSTAHTRCAGTWGWTPTEYFDETMNRRSKKAGDVQVAGYLAYYILSDGHHPFEHSHPYYENENLAHLAVNIKEGTFRLDHTPKIKCYPQESIRILKEMLHPKWEERPFLIRCHLHFKVPMVSPFEKFLAIFSTYLTTLLTGELCDKIKLTGLEKERITTSINPGFSFLRKLVEKGKIQSNNIEYLKKVMKELRMVQAVVKIDDYITQVKKNERESRHQKANMTYEETFELFASHLRQKLERWYSSICPFPWKKTCDRHLKDLFTDCGLFIPTRESKVTQLQVDEKSLLQYTAPLSKEKYRHFKYVVVEGDPGSGKTILTAQLAFDWCQGEFSDIDMVIPLPLKLVENMTLVEAVKELWFHDDFFFNKEHIKEILQHGKRCFILDGVEEYIGGNQSSGYLCRVKELMQEFDDAQCQVIVTARPEHITDKSDLTDALVLRMGQLVESKRRLYIEKAYPEERAKQVQMSQSIEDHPILRHICTIPLLFVMALNNLQNLLAERFKGQSPSVTRFMELIMKDFCPFLWKVQSHNTVNALAKIAFQGLCRRKPRLLWRMEFFERNVKNINKIIDSGILVVEEELPFTKFFNGDCMMNTENESGRTSDYQEDSKSEGLFPSTKMKMEGQKTTANLRNLHPASDEHAQKQEFPKVPLHVRFLHNIIQEWFAAKYVSSVIAKGKEEDIKRHLTVIDETKLRYMLRFLCDMCGSNHQYIFDYLIQKINANAARAPMILNCIALCLMEISIREEIFPDLHGTLSKYPIMITQDEEEILQIAKVNLLNMACDRKLTICNLTLLDVLSNATKTGLHLRCGGYIKELRHIKSVHISHWGTSRLDDEQYGDLITFLVQNSTIPEIELQFPSKPPELNHEAAKSVAYSNATVTWHIGAKVKHLLDVQTGTWILAGGKPISDTKEGDSESSPQDAPTNS